MPVSFWPTKESETVTTAKATPDAEPSPAAAEPAPARKPRGRKPGSANKTRTVELTLTLTGTADGEWQAELSQAGTWVVRDLAIPAASVARAAAELHEDIAKAIDTVLDGARQAHRARMEELEAELAKVRQALAGLDDDH